MYDKYVVKYVVTTFDKEGQELFERYHTNEETAVKDTVQFIGQLVQAGFVVPTKEDRTW